MVLNNIEQLLEKYQNGSTTLQEEQQLKHYFSQDEVASHLEVYKPMFQYFLVTKQEQFTKNVPLQTKKYIPIYKWISVAAVVTLMFGVYMYTMPSYPTNNEIQQARIETQRALNLLSVNFNKGVSQIRYINALEESTNRILKTKE